MDQTVLPEATVENTISLRRACEQGRVREVSMMLDTYRYRRECLEEYFVDAAQLGHLDVMKILNGKGININLIDIYGKTALHSACSNGCLNVVQWLVSFGSDLDLEIKYNFLERGRTSLHIAAYSGHKDIVQCLIDAGANLFAKTN